MPTVVGTRTREILQSVFEERQRQYRLLTENGFSDCADPDVGFDYKLPVLIEEIGEVALAINDSQTDEELQEELIQVAAVAVAWAESLCQ